MVSGPGRRIGKVQGLYGPPRVGGWWPVGQIRTPLGQVGFAPQPHNFFIPCGGGKRRDGQQAVGHGVPPERGAARV